MGNLKIKLLIVLVVVSSFFGFLEWGNKHYFLIQIEIELILKATSDFKSVIHPFTIIPFLSQLLLIVSLFQVKPNRLLVSSSIVGLLLLIGFIFFIGIIVLNWKIILSALPFLIVSIITFITLLKNKKNEQET